MAVGEEGGFGRRKVQCRQDLMGQLGMEKKLCWRKQLVLVSAVISESSHPLE
jgi:hypothetical protein